MAKEPIPKPEVCFSPGTFILSAYGTIVYEILSYPLCRLYPQFIDDPDLSSAARGYLKFSADGFAFTSWKTESAWYEHSDPKKGWVRDGANFPSYVVRIWDDDGIPSDKTSYITLRWHPVTDATYKGILSKVEAVRSAAVTLDTTIHAPTLPEKIILRARNYVSV